MKKGKVVLSAKIIVTYCEDTGDKAYEIKMDHHNFYQKKMEKVFDPSMHYFYHDALLNAAKNLIDIASGHIISNSKLLSKVK